MNKTDLVEYEEWGGGKRNRKIIYLQILLSAMKNTNKVLR